MTTSAVTASTPISRKPRRMARDPHKHAEPASVGPAAPSDGALPTKLDRIEALLLAPAGASIAEIIAATGWQQHSVRGAIAGALKKRGLVITSEKVGGERRYRAGRPA